MVKGYYFPLCIYIYISCLLIIYCEFWNICEITLFIALDCFACLLLQLWKGKTDNCLTQIRSQSWNSEIMPHVYRTCMYFNIYLGPIVLAYMPFYLYSFAPTWLNLVRYWLTLQYHFHTFGPWSYSMSYCHVKWVFFYLFFFLLRNASLKHCPLSVPHPFSWRPPRPFWSIRAFSQPALMCGIIATPWILMAPQKAVWICTREHLQQNIILLFLSILVHFHI